MNRALTPIERLAVRGVVERIALLLAEVWQDHIPLALEVTSFESFPEMVQMANREEPVLVANIEVSVENQRSLLLLCLPFCALEDFFNSGDKNRVGEMTGTEQERAASRELTEVSLRATHIDVCARLPVVQIPMRQLVGLPVGSILATGHPTDTVLDVLVSGRPRFHATVGRVGPKLAVRLLDVPTAAGSAGSGCSSRAL
jgi:flagellar motor switch protein FliM